MYKTVLLVLLVLFPSLLSESKTVLAQSAEPSLLFNPTQISTTANQDFTANIVIDTAGKDAAGAGAEIFYDVQYLEITKIDTFPIFDTYPTVTQDNRQGIASISGINEPGDKEFYKGKDTLATITFHAKSAGQATVKFNFLPNNTRDSNIAVTTGNGDILSKVNTLQVTIAPNPQANVDISASPKSQPNTPAGPNYTLYLLVGLAVFLVIVVVAIIFILISRKKNHPHQSGPTIIIPTPPSIPVPTSSPQSSTNPPLSPPIS